MDFYRHASYDPAVPSLEQALGYDWGERISSPLNIEAYFRRLAEGNAAALLVEYGRSVEGRPLIYMAVSQPGNLARLEEIKSNLRRLADPRQCDREEAARLIDATPAVTWVAANVHGGEHSTAEAATLLAYHLLAGQDETTRRIRRETVVVIDPLQNPDGRARSVQYYYSAFGLGVNPDANAAEHHWPWPGPRGNHYLFDLNRDWMLLSQSETPHKVRAFLEWRPQVYADLHEMGHNSSFFFFPPAPPVNANYPPVTLHWWEAYGKAIAAWFDEYGFDYYSRERFDAFYPGYGESWPSFHGATGMTFEQASVRGLSIRREDGADLTLREALHHHFVAALATCALTAEQRADRLWGHYAFHEDGVLAAQAGPVKEYLIPPQPGARALAANLADQGVEVAVAGEPFRPQGARDAVTGAEASGALPAGTFVFRLDQPYSRYLQAVLEPRTQLPADFLEEELANAEGRLPDRFYDITAWSRPLALGLSLLEAGAFSQAATVPLANAPSGPKALPEMDAAYVLPNESGASVALAARLRREGFRVHCARKRFAAGGRDYGAGAFILRRAGNEGLAPALAAAFADTAGDVEVVSLPTLWTETGGVDLGSEDVIALKAPRIAVLYDWPVASLSFGWIAFLLEQRYRIPFTALRRDRLLAAEFREYDVLVLPHGTDYPKALGAEHDEWLKAWTHAGGVLVGIGKGAAHLCRPEADLTGVRVLEDLRLAGRPPTETDAPPPDPPPPAPGPNPPAADPDPQSRIENRESKIPPEHRPVRVPGAFLNVELDRHHPLTAGYRDPTSIFYDGSVLLARGPETHPVAAFAPSERLTVSGFVWKKMAAALPGHLWLAEEPCGSGHVVLFASDPTYRTAWDHMHRFFLNALLLLPSVKRPSQ